MTQADAPTHASDAPEALPAGTRVAEFEVRRVLGSGGFGIVYLAWDHALEREVALKEYMPGTLAGRGAGLLVSVRSKATADTFALGMRSFINEARLLARFDHPSLVKVYRFWEDNGTAYMVMPRYLGRTLRQARHAMVVPPGDAACRRVLDALLSALEVLHREGVYHRDIAPDNILLGDDGLPVLLDFGAARRVLGDQTQALTSIMKPHYAPLEQYADSSAMRQGPWTDLYALGGTMYYLITGQVPMAAASRALHDDQPRLAVQGARSCSHGLLAAIDWMLALRPPERPQSVHMLRDVLEGRITLPGRSAADKTAPGVAARQAHTVPSVPRTDIDLNDDLPDGLEPSGASSGVAENLPQSSASDHPHEATVLQAHAGVAAAPGAAVMNAPPTLPPSTLPPPPRSPSTAPPTRRASVTAARVLGSLVVLNLLAWWWFTQPAAPTSAPSIQAESSPPPARADTSKGSTAPTPA
ncbi:MAG: serine/threonine-protein kinase, partial [Burkholderiaceae bacterium]